MGHPAIRLKPARALRRWLALAAAGVAVAWAGLAAAAPAPGELDAGARIYLEGILPDGSALRGRRADGRPVEGRLAACVNCHQRSGLGGAEGNVVIPPITGRALFGVGEPVTVRFDLRLNGSLSKPHEPYDANTFARIVREGRLPDGREAHGLMPRFALDDAGLAALTGYLKTLSVAPSPGVTPGLIHLATVVTPGVAPAREAAWLDTLLAAVDQHNLNVVSGLRQRVPAAERRLQTRRRWTLAVWHLEGEAATWGAQLARFQSHEPAFAIVSGLSNGPWLPVQEFCDVQRVACWFPSLDSTPPTAQSAEMSLYFSRGVALEADVVASRLLAGDRPPQRLLVLRQPGAAGEAAAAGLRAALGHGPTAVQDMVWRPDALPAIAAALAQLQPRDAVVAWLDAAALEQLAALPVVHARVCISTAFAPDASARIGAAWRAVATVVDRYEQPTMRAANLKQFHAWRLMRGLPLVDERSQAEAYFAVNFLAATLTDMLNNLHADYLVERAQLTLSLREAERAQMETQAMMMGGGARQPVAPASAGAARPPDLVALLARQGTTPYPRLSLGTGQRFASKGAYLILPDSASALPAAQAVEWVVP